MNSFLRSLECLACLQHILFTSKEIVIESEIVNRIQIEYYTEIEEERDFERKSATSTAARIVLRRIYFQKCK